jgi:hypothetical protein
MSENVCIFQEGCIAFTDGCFSLLLTVVGTCMKLLSVPDIRLGMFDMFRNVSVIMSSVCKLDDCCVFAGDMVDMNT